MRVALEIIDREGLEAASMRTIAEGLGVNAATLYYHVQNKAEILEDVARHVLWDVKVRLKQPPTDWLGASVEMMETFRASMMRHPNILGLIALRVDRNFEPSGLAYSAGILAQAGVPVDKIPLLHDAMRALAIGAVTLATAEANVRRNDEQDAAVLELWLRALLVGYAEVAPSFDLHDDS